MSQQLREFLDKVSQVEAEPQEWAQLQARVADAMAEAHTVVTATNAGVARPSHPVQSVVSTPGSGWLTWLGGSLAASALLAAVLVGTSGPAAVTARGERDALPGASPIWQPLVVEGNLTEGRAETWSSPRRRAGKKAETIATAPEPPTPVVGERAGEAVKRSVVISPAEVRLWGESDVEYDRRHLAPIDAALQARQPHEALELLARFRPRKLTNYASALQAIAWCTAGETEAGRRLGTRTLPRLTNRGMARRVANACNLVPAKD